MEKSNHPKGYFYYICPATKAIQEELFINQHDSKNKKFYNKKNI